MSGGETQWDSSVREGTHFNQPASGDGGGAWESRALTSTPGQWGAIPTAQPGPTGSGKERMFSSKRTLNFLVLPSWKKPFYPRPTQPAQKRFKRGAAIACVTGMLMGLWAHSGLPSQPCSREERFAEKQEFDITLRSYLLKLWDADWNLAWSKTDCISSLKSSD